MTDNAADLQRRIDVLEQRLERMSEAAARVNSNLDLEEVLQELLDSARVLTRARYGIIATVDSSGHVAEFVTSGFTKGDSDRMVAWSEGPNLFEHLRDLREPVRLADLPSYVNSLGFSTEVIPTRTFQSTPLYHRGAQVGNVFLGGKSEDREFTVADDDVLRSFASQAATAIANARTRRSEQRVRADLDTLIQSSPVGVVVFSGQTGELISYNEEARRIVSELETPGRDIEDLLSILTCRRADGRDFSLEESPLVRYLSDPETVYAEEITLSVPDGRNVSLLCNATPIRSSDGVVESMVVIMQDLAPIKQLARLRGEIFSKVSVELRTPLIAIKGSSATALDAKPRLDPNEMLQYFRVIDEQADRMRGLIGNLLDYGRIATGTLELNQTVVEVATLVDKGQKAFQREFEHRAVNVEIDPALPAVLVDPTRIEQVISTLLAVTSKHADPLYAIEVTASQQDVLVAISLEATNWRIPSTRLPHLFDRYSVPSNEQDPAAIDDGEIDLAICRGLVEASGGRIWAETNASQNRTQITFTLPMALDAHLSTSIVPKIGFRSSSITDSSSASQILVVNANPHMQRYIQESLTAPEFEIAFAEFDEELNDKLDSINPALVLLDLQQYGYALPNKIAEVSAISDAPVIFIAPYGIDEVVSKTLEAGAADYIVTPFSPAELIARVRGVLRRQALPVPFALGELQIDYDQRIVRIGENQIDLTATEYELLRVLSANVGRVMTYSMLLRQVWGKRDQDAEDPTIVRAVVKRLRNKLGDDAAKPEYICNKRGVGYFISTSIA